MNEEEAAVGYILVVSFAMRIFPSRRRCVPRLSSANFTVQPETRLPHSCLQYIAFRYLSHLPQFFGVFVDCRIASVFFFLSRSGCLMYVYICTCIWFACVPPFVVWRQAWTLEVSPDGSFVLSGGHDRSLRLWRRTEEMVFLEEEREKEMEGLFESELDRDDVAAPGADGLVPPPQRKPEGRRGGATLRGSGHRLLSTTRVTAVHCASTSPTRP